MAIFPLEIVPGDSWHPLDKKPAPTYIPPFWIGPHVGLRLVEALRTLQRLPMKGGPRVFGNCWPNYAWDFADLLAQQEADAEQKHSEAQAQNRTRLLPSSIEIAAMETPIIWPARYLRDVPQLLRTVQMAALGRSRDRDLEWTARKLKLPGRLARRWNCEGLDTIAEGLRRDSVAVR